MPVPVDSMLPVCICAAFQTTQFRQFVDNLPMACVAAKHEADDVYFHMAIVSRPTAEAGFVENIL